MKIQEYFSNPFLGQKFQRSKRFLIYSAINLDATDVGKEKSITFNVRIGNSLSPTEIGECDMVI